MGQANYSAAKEGIVGFTRTVARDMGRYGVTCNAIRPIAATRLTVTPELTAAWERRATRGLDDPALGQYVAELMSSTPEAVSPLVAFLCTDEAANINGCTFDVHGGAIALYSEPVPIRTIHKVGTWSVDELCQLIPKSIASGLVNPSPPRTRKQEG
jgi:NAD(P)-dependent dehydrogenase (short-subunit alcohol dehydrogenase family)